MEMKRVVSIIISYNKYFHFGMFEL